MPAPEAPPSASDVAPASFAGLYADQYGHMVRLAHLLIGSNAVAEELVQDAFVRVYERWAHVEHPPAYLRQAVVNACRSYRRSRSRERRRTSVSATQIAASDVDELRDALASLSVRQRAAVVLRYYEDLPEAEIARLLECRPGTVKSLLARGLERLRKVIPE
jgi:RNA polymerase sigma-70 factor (sigma-E family)